jgi:hypothetical protein
VLFQEIEQVLFRQADHGLIFRLGEMQIVAPLVA